MIMDTTLQLAHPCSFYHSGLSSRPPFMAASGQLAHAQVWVLLESIFHQSFVTTFCSCRSALDRAKIYHLTSQRHCFPFQKNLSSCCVLHDSFKPSMLAWLHILPMERLSSLKLTSARHKLQFHGLIQTRAFAEAVHTNPDLELFFSQYILISLQLHYLLVFSAPQ